MHFRQIISLLFIIILLQTFVFNISSLYFFDAEKNTDDISNEQYFEAHQLPFIFLKQQNTSQSIKLDSGSSFIVIFGTFAKKIALPVFDFKHQTKHIFIKQNVPLFIKGRSLRN
jgi:hypothetical protein